MEFSTLTPEDVTTRSRGHQELSSDFPIHRSGKGTNVNSMERVVSAALGAAALASAVKRRDAGSALLAVLGGGLVYRGVTGKCPAYRAAGISTAGENPGRTKLHWQPGHDPEQPDQTLHWGGAGERCRGFMRLRESDDQRGTEADIHVRLDPRSGSVVGGILNVLHFIPLVLSSKAFQRLRGTY